MMKVLFIGGTGLISSAVAELAAAKNIDLYLFNRGQRNEFMPAGATYIKGDIRDRSSAAGILKKYHFDVVVDWIGYTPDHVATDIDLFAGKVRQYIFISSASVYQKPQTHYLITESTPLANPYWQYSRDKIACEDRLMQAYRDHGFPVTIVRPSHTYGLTMIPAALNSSAHPWTLVDRMRRGKKIIVHGDGSSLWVMTHNTDFARGFIGLLNNSQTIGHAFHITSDEVLNWNQVYQTIGAAAGVLPDLIHLPSDFITVLYPEKTGSLIGDKSVSVVFDNSKIKRFVPGFVATVPFAEGVRRSIKWFEADPARCTIDEDYNRLMDRIISAYMKHLIPFLVQQKHDKP